MNREVKMKTQRGGVHGRNTDGKRQRRREKSIKMCDSRISSVQAGMDLCQKKRKSSLTVTRPSSVGRKINKLRVQASTGRFPGCWLLSQAACGHQVFCCKSCSLPSFSNSSPQSVMSLLFSLQKSVFFCCSANLQWAHQL